jgi:hypothetical protein
MHFLTLIAFSILLAVRTAADPDYWLADVAHQGYAPYAEGGYAVFRNVLDYGAAGTLLSQMRWKKPVTDSSV